jgi:hypothetical protein
MRFLLAFFVLLLLPGLVCCQTQDIDPPKMIERIISSGVFYGVEEKRLDQMGDAAAVVVTKVLADKNSSAREIGAILDIIHLSFSAPRLVENVPDREPRTTQFILQYLNLANTDKKLKKRIAEEKEFVLTQYTEAPRD